MKNKNKYKISSELTSTSLQAVLWDTLRGLKSKKIRPAEANAIASQAREICRVSKLNLEYMKLAGAKPTKNSGILSLE